MQHDDSIHSPSHSAHAERARHWEDVYARKADSELSWFQPNPSLSLDLIRSLRPHPHAVIDIGGGQSALSARLLAEGIAGEEIAGGEIAGGEIAGGKITVLDISPSAIMRARTRAGEDAARIRWIVADILTTDHLPKVDLWHDRAVFHFLTDAGDRARYAARMAESVHPGGHAIIATFAPTGPEKCSGLPVARHDAEGLASIFAPEFVLERAVSESHATPWGKPQDFVYAVLRRV